MATANDVIRIASSQLGVAEDPRGSNNVLYNTAYYGKPVSGNYPWCMAFVWWVFREAGMGKAFYGGRKTASCTTLREWAKRQGQWVTSNYRRGDVILFQFDDDDYADHTGICERVDSDKIICIEGNTNDEVRWVSRNLSYVMGAWRPNYDDEPQPTVNITLPEVRYGDVGKTVMAMQMLLVGHGYKLPKYGCDGEFGDETLESLKRFQRGACLPETGECSTAEWQDLLGVSS